MRKEEAKEGGKESGKEGVEERLGKVTWLDENQIVHLFILAFTKSVLLGRWLSSLPPLLDFCCDSHIVKIDWIH